MGYLPGDSVHVSGFGKGLVREARNGDRYLVEVKGRAMAVAGSLLTAVERPRDETASRTRATPAVPEVRAHRARPAPRSLDLHGLGVDDAIEALDRCLNDALLADAPELHIIHGRGGGRIKSAVHKRLAAVPAVRAFRLDARNPGVTVVVL